MKDSTSLLVVIEPGRKLESLRVLLQGFDQIDRVLETKSVVSAWKVLASESPDFVLIDMDLPNSDSWQFLERVKNGSHCIQIVALVSNSRQIQAAQQAGAGHQAVHLRDPGRPQGHLELHQSRRDLCSARRSCRGGK